MAGRRRQRGSSSQEQMIPRAYRLHFFYEPLGRYFRSSKRRLYWSFGFTNIDAALEGKTGGECRGEEHEVELVWSLKSGKTRVYWNKRNISNLIQQDVKSNTVHMSWNTYTGERLQVVAHAEAIPGVAQYDLLIDGVSFSQMPSVLEINSSELVVAASESSDLSDDSNSILEGGEYITKQSALCSQSEHMGSSGSELDSFQSLADRHPCDGKDGMGYRLSMVGLSSGLAGVDELHSEVYSPMLESLRQRIVECLPQTEEMISRAIIHTFFPDYVSQSSLDLMSSKSVSSEEKEPQQIEVDALCDAYEWARIDKSHEALISAPLQRPNSISIPHRARSAPVIGSKPTANYDDDGELNYMQKLIDFIFIKVRNEDVSSDEGARILLGVAAVLRLDFARPLPTDTVLLDNLGPYVTVEDLSAKLSEYGDLEAVGISSKRTNFGFCRFMSEESFRRFLEADEAGTFDLSGQRPTVIPLTEKMFETMADTSSRDCSNHDEGRALSPTPTQSTTRGQSSTIPHLMGAWTDDEEADGVEQMVVSSDLMGAWTDDDAEREKEEPMVVTPDYSCREVIQQKVSLSSPRSSVTDFEDLVEAPSTCSF
ncbi:hypothetical protein ACA910_000521 [Epithemia clementina (nom. ined.)]